MDEDIKSILEEINALFEKNHLLQESIEQHQENLNQQQIEITELTEKLAKSTTEETNWQRLSDTLQNTLTLVTHSSDHSAWEEKICNLKSENERISNELVDLQTNFELKISEVEYKQTTKWTATKSSLENQIEALKLTKDLDQTDVYQKCEELEQKCDQITAENRDNYNKMVLHYEKLLQCVRLDNADLEKENVQLIRDKENLKAEIHKNNLQIEHHNERIQKHSEPQKVDAATDTTEDLGTIGADVEGLTTRKRKLYTKPSYEDGDGGLV